MTDRADHKIEQLADEFQKGFAANDLTGALSKLNEELQSSRGQTADLAILGKLNEELVERGFLPALSFTPAGRESEIVVGVNASLNMNRRTADFTTKPLPASGELPEDEMEDEPQEFRKICSAVARFNEHLLRFRRSNGAFHPILPPGMDFNNGSPEIYPELNEDGSITRKVAAESNGVKLAGEQRFTPAGVLLESSARYSKPTNIELAGPHGKSVKLWGVESVDTTLDPETGKYETTIRTARENLKLTHKEDGSFESAQRRIRRNPEPGATPTRPRDEDLEVPPRLPRTRGAQNRPEMQPEQSPTTPDGPRPSETANTEKPALPTPERSKHESRLQQVSHESRQERTTAPEQAPEKPASESNALATVPSIFQFIAENWDKFNEDGYITEKGIDKFIQENDIPKPVINRLLKLKDRWHQLIHAHKGNDESNGMTGYDLEQIMKNAATMAYLKGNFAGIDADGNGRLGADELKAAIEKGAELPDSLKQGLSDVLDRISAIEVMNKDISTLLPDIITSSDSGSGISFGDIMAVEQELGLDDHIASPFQVAK